MTELLRNPKADKTKARTFKPVRPNLSIEIAYGEKLKKLIDQMNASVIYWVRAKYKANEPAILASDALPATVMRNEVRKMAKRWQDNFDQAAPKLADFFAESVQTRSEHDLMKILRDGGFTVKFNPTRAQRDIFKATVGGNVELIKTIPQQYLSNVMGSVMRSVQRGGDLSELSEELRTHYGVTRRRAEFIARSQNRMASASMNKARMTELGLFENVWLHSAAGKTPRPTHVEAGRSKTVFDIRNGWYDPDPKVAKFIQPGELPNCRCVSKAIVPGF